MKELFKRCIVYLITLEAKLILKKHKPIIIGVTGNLGKTTTKDSVVAAMHGLDIRGTDKSLNSEFGVPLTILGEKSGWNNPIKWIKILLKGFPVYFKKDYPRYLVLEIGADHRGDIQSITKWLKTDVTILTQFSEIPVHVENFNSKEELVREKMYLAEAIKEGGLFIYNADCEDSVSIANQIKTKKISFGIHSGDVTAKNIHNFLYPAKVEADFVITKDRSVHIVCLDVVGNSPILCALPAIIVADHFKVDLKEASSSLESVERASGRMKVLSGKENSLIIDDSYNASPLATEHGLKTLGSLDVKGRKIAIIGDMLELGEYTREAHLKVGKIARDNLHTLVTVGNRARSVAEGALDNGMNSECILQCDNARDAAREVLNILKEGDVVYVKGSQGMRLERAVKMLLADDLDSKHLLVRQDEEWLKR